MISIKTFAFNLLQENTYVVSDDTLECVIIDCGAYYDDERRAITDYISSQGLKPVRLLATHGHWDHNLGIDTIYQTYGLRVEAAKEDEFIISDIPHNFQSIIGAPLRREYPAVGRFFTPDEVIRFGHHSLQVLKTPARQRRLLLCRRAHRLHRRHPLPHERRPHRLRRRQLYRPDEQPHQCSGEAAR